MPKFATGDPVTTKHGPGIVWRVYPARINPTYLVGFDDGQRREIFTEDELTPAEKQISGARPCPAI